MQVRAFVDEPELASVEKNQLVQIAWSGRTWTGRVERLPGAIVVRGERHVGEVICSLDDSRHLIPNLDVDVKIRLQSRSRALLVPREAVHRDQSGPPFVFLVQDGTLRRRPVDIDVASPTDDAIRSGVAEGDTVALSGSVNLQEGMRVQVTP
jgi:HlyD family secretion protein